MFEEENDNEEEKEEIQIIEEEKEEIETEKEKEKEFECRLEKCSQCIEESVSLNLCEKCNELKGYYPLKEYFTEDEKLIKNVNYINCFNNITKPSNYFLNKLEKYYEPCFESCEACEYGGDKFNNNCTSCDFGYISAPGINNTFNCIIKCPYYFYYTKFNQYKCSKLTLCPEDYYLLIRPKEQCIENCSKDDEYKYQYNGECYKECPENSSNINNDYICLDNNINICSLSKREILIKNEIITEEEKETLAKSYAKEYLYTDNHLSLFNYSKYEIAIYKNYECVSELGLEIPRVDLGDCYQKIKKKYNISDNLIIAIIVQRNSGLKYPIISSFSVYSPYKGIKLNIDICQNENLNVQEDIAMKISDKHQFSYVHYLSQQNIDVFNSSSDFYTDLCYFFNSPVKKDVALKDRIKLFFPNITLCENGCRIKGINATSMKAECECKLNNLINNNILSNNAWYQSQIGEIEELLSKINIDILKCGSNSLKYKKIYSYVGL